MQDLQKLNDWLDEQLRTWVEQFIRDRVSLLRSKGIKASGELIRSMDYDIRNAAFAEGRELLLAFKEYGRMIDMRRIKPHEIGEAMIEGIMESVRKGGIEKYKAGFLRRRKYLPKSNEKLLSQIAWGIARKRSKGKRKRKKWYNRSKAAAINDLFNTVAANIPDIVGDEIAKQFPKEI